jgi:hypothetical protein
MTIRASFAPRYGSGVTVATSTTSGTTTIGDGNKTLLFTNLDATNAVYVRTSKGSSTATAADLIVRAGQQITISKDQDHDTVAHIAAAGTPSMNIIAGEGGI